MTNDDESLMTLTCSTSEEKLLWERRHNKLFIEQIKELRVALNKTNAAFLSYKQEVSNTQNSQMLNKLNKLKAKYEGVDELIEKLRLDNSNLQCALGKANLMLKDNQPKSLLKKCLDLLSKRKK
jgi:predicted nuclease with TOPRIM domain